MTNIRKASTTVAKFDDVLNLSTTERTHIYGMREQQRLDFIWDILSEGGLGLVFLIDNASDNSCADLDFYLNAFREPINDTILVIGVTKLDRKSNPTLSDYANYLRKLDQRFPVLEVDTGKQRDAWILTQVLLLYLVPRVS